MKESDITPEVITMAKEIAEIWRMEIYEGCWIITTHKELAFIIEEERDDWTTDLLGYYVRGNKNSYFDLGRLEQIIPIPSISDCLEKLRELQYYVQWNDNLDFYEIFIWEDLDDVPKIINCKWRLHEALLSAFLEVLTKQKKEK